MSTDERKNRILELLQENGIVKVNALSENLGISEVTVRNYLTEMEKMGLLTRVHGGAISSYKPCSMNFNQRLETNQSEKESIAAKISEMIEPNDTIMLNAGTTTLLVFRHLPADYNLNIVTNSISIALEASSNPNYNVTLVGGQVNSKYHFTYGSDAIEQIKNYHANKLVLSVDGIDTESGFSTYYSEETHLDKAMIKQSDICIIAADKSKFRRNAFAKISDIDCADFIVTTCNLNSEEKELLSQKDISVINVK